VSNAILDSTRRDKLNTTALVCVAASAGGIGALSTLLDQIPPDLPMAMVIVQHLSPDHQSRLAEILSRHTHMPVTAIADGDRIKQGEIHVAPPGTHAIVSSAGILNLTSTDRVQHVRPSADLLFASAAEHYPGRVIAIILTGMGHDGSDGVRAVHAAGGVVIVENPETAAFRSMPESAVATGTVDYILSLEEIATTVASILEPGETA
jgi:two-component system, chemotaxis family, protein-glutamate methylesterase/glutaminase